MIFDSTMLAEGGWLPTYIFMSLVTLADKDGYVEIAPKVLYLKLGLATHENKVEYTDFEQALGFLGQTDSGSKSTDFDGKRIIPIAELSDIKGGRGWWIVNYATYRNLGSREDRSAQSTERSRRWREREKSNEINDGTPGDAQGRKGRHTDTDTDTDKDNNTTRENGVSTKVPFQIIVDKWNALAERIGLPQTIKITASLKGQIRQRWKDMPMLENWDNFFSYVENNKFLSGRSSPGPNRETPFRSTLLWITKEGNFAKIAAKEYD